MTIKEARIEAGLTQQHMSELLEIPLPTIKKWETEVRKPPVWAEKLIIEKLQGMRNECKE